MLLRSQLLRVQYREIGHLELLGHKTALLQRHFLTLQLLRLRLVLFLQIYNLLLQLPVFLDLWILPVGLHLVFLSKLKDVVV